MIEYRINFPPSYPSDKRNSIKEHITQNMPEKIQNFHWYYHIDSKVYRFEPAFYPDAIELTYIEER